MSLRRTLRSGVAAVAIATVAAPSGVWAAHAAAGLEVHVAQAQDFSRIVGFEIERSKAGMKR